MTSLPKSLLFSNFLTWTCVPKMMVMWKMRKKKRRRMRRGNRGKKILHSSLLLLLPQLSLPVFLHPLSMPFLLNQRKLNKEWQLSRKVYPLPIAMWVSCFQCSLYPFARCFWTKAPVKVIKTSKTHLSRDFVPICETQSTLPVIAVLESRKLSDWGGLSMAPC